MASRSTTENEHQPLLVIWVIVPVVVSWKLGGRSLGVCGLVSRRWGGAGAEMVKLLTTPQPLQLYPSAGLDLGTDMTSLSNVIFGAGRQVKRGKE